MKNKYVGMVAGALALVLALTLGGLVSADSTGSLLPSTEGYYLQWTPKSGSTHYTMVDESSCNGTTDYNSTSTVGNRDSYGVSLSSVPNGSTITQIVITPCASKNNNGGGPSTMNVFYRFNGSNSSDAGNYSLSGTTPSQLSATSFSGLSLVKGGSSALEVGAVYSAGTKGVRLSRLAVVVTYTQLSSPSGLTSSVAGSDVNLDWTDTSSNEDGFLIERSDNGGSFFNIATTSANVISYDDIGLSVGTYVHRVRAYNTGGYSGYSNNATSTIVVAPTVSTSAASSVTNSSATLNGSANPNSTASTGWFRYSTSNPGSCNDSFGTRAPASGGTSLGSGTSSVPYSRNIFSLSAGTTYYYCAIASNAGGTGFGSVVSFTTIPFAPSAPTGISASVVGSDVNLGWTDTSSNEDGFLIERSDNGGSSFFNIATTTADVVSYSDMGLASGTYIHRVRAYNTGGYSGYTTHATSTIP